MLGILRKLSRTGGEAAPPPPPAPPVVVDFEGGPGFVVADHLEHHEGFPYMRWSEVWEWAEGFPTARQPAAFDAAAKAWNEHLCAALGPTYRISRRPGALVISTLAPREAAATLDFMLKTQRRILQSLDGIARGWEAGEDLLIVVDDEDTYYRFISRFYPEGGQYSRSSGVQLNDDGVYYYACPKGHLRDIEPVIAHEMTHGFVSHLPLPKWLNEGIAVNMERRLTGSGYSSYRPDELRAKHLAFWDADKVQALWSGDSFDLPDDANMLSYDLSRILVGQMSGDWQRFAAFVNDARHEDAGAAAARTHLGLPLGHAVAALLEREVPADYEPRIPPSH